MDSKRGKTSTISVMQIGIGITTCDRPELLKKCLSKINKHTKEFTIYVADDSNRYEGVAYGKNECLRALSTCDHVFLFDDDCYPIKDGWVDFFINSGQEHLLFLNYTHNYYKTLESNVRLYKDCGGVFMYMNREGLKKGGWFNENYGVWGFEHAEYSCKILGGHGKYPMLTGTNKYLYSEDYMNPNHESVLKKEEKIICFNKNLPIFTKFLSDNGYTL